MDLNLIGIIVCSVAVGGLGVIIWALNTPDEESDEEIRRASDRVRRIEKELEDLKK